MPLHGISITRVIDFAGTRRRYFSGWFDMIQQDRNMLFTMAVCFGTSMGFAGIGFLLMVEANAQTFASVLVLYFIAGTVLSLGLYQASRSSKLAFRKLTYHLAMKCVNYQLSFGLAGLPVSLLSPTDNATSVSLTANLVITFNEVVTVNTGNILIRKTSDDTIVETIDVASGLVTGTGTTTITIDPSVSLSSATEYYVQITSGAFRDAVLNERIEHPAGRIGIPFRDADPFQAHIRDHFSRHCRLVGKILPFLRDLPLEDTLHFHFHVAREFDESAGIGFIGGLGRTADPEIVSATDGILLRVGPLRFRLHEQKRGTDDEKREYILYSTCHNEKAHRNFPMGLICSLWNELTAAAADSAQVSAVQVRLFVRIG